ncbi:hypothetical protein CASFOL_002111 [Castilleja foliolosa]|uniref:Transposase (putative) gypsy type domain-containing protein n=1 Tax=Castilleja foliolosa TaxID=1961234 RepID=A0ABD3EDK5_9LAMI
MPSNRTVDVKPRFEILAPWSLIRSKISNSDVSLIRKKFFIPDEYQIIVPGPNDKIDEPPERCLAFHVASLEAGLRFPLSRHVEDIISGLNVCPAQLMPNSYRHILSFIILARHFEVDPSFFNFRNLISIVSSSKTGEIGFFYLTPRPKRKLLHNLPSKLSRWKNKFIYVMSPGNNPWRVPNRWNNDTRYPRISVLKSPSWGHDFISNQLTMTFYESSKILKEDVLVLAGLSPAPIKTNQSLGMAVRASMVAKAMREQKDALMSRYQRPVVQDTDGLGKRARAEDLSCQEVPTVDWVNRAEKIVGDMRRDHDGSGSLDGIFKPSKDAFEKYKYTLRDDDQMVLVDLPLTKLEDAVAYHSLAINGIVHHLLLRAAYTKNELLSCERKLNKADQKASDHVRLKELEQSLSDTKHEKMLLQKRIEEMQLKRDREQMDSFNAGRAAGRQEFVESEEYRSAVKRAREEGVRAFVKSNTYATHVAKNAAVYEFDGFEKCRAQAMKLGAFRREFDTRQLDPFKDGNLEDPVYEDEVCCGEDEFAYLL